MRRRRVLGVTLAVVVAAAATVVLTVGGDGDTAGQSRMWRQVVVAGDDWIVLGATLDGSVVQGVLWQVRRDGHERRLPNPSPEAMVSALAVDGTTVFAAGSEGRDAAVWALDGERWAVVHRHKPPGADMVSAVFSAVAAAGGRVVAAGHVLDQTSRPISATQGPDGWVEGVLPGGNASVMGLTATDSGFVAVGARQEPLAPVAWTSGDGISWSLEQMPWGGDGQGAAQFVAARGDGAVAVGVSERAPATWIRDGQVWSGPARFPDPVPGRAVAAVAATSAGFVAVGQVVGLGDVVAPEGWVSRDGRTWQPLSVAGADVGRLVAVFEDDSGVVVVGETESGAPVLHDLRGRSLFRRS